MGHTVFKTDVAKIAGGQAGSTAGAPVLPNDNAAGDGGDGVVEAGIQAIASAGVARFGEPLRHDAAADRAA